MGKFIKYALLGILGLVVFVFVAVFVLAMTIDPNEYRDEIIAEVEKTTGRNMEIDGDISLTIFPVLSLEFGAIRLGNAEGFDPDVDFLSLASASASVRVLPLLFGRELRMGTVSVQSLAVNLAVNESGRSNWDDLAETGTTPPPETQSGAGTSGDGLAGFEVGGLDISNASLTYTDAQAGSRYALTNMNLRSGPAALGKPLSLDGGFEFSAEPDAISGNINMGVTVTLADESLVVRGLEVSGTVQGVTPSPATFSLNTDSVDVDLVAEQSVQSPIRFSLGSMTAIAQVRPFNYGTGLTPQVELEVPAFSPKSLMNELGLEPIETADPDALERVSFSALYFENDNFHQLNDLEIQVDDTTFQGLAGLPVSESGYYRLGLAGDSIDLARYMAPPSEEVASGTGEAGTVEIPVDLLRAFDTKANFRMEEVTLGGLAFTNIEVRIESDGGNARIHPISADFFEGRYEGDIRIDASTDNVLMSVNERVADVQLGPLLKAMYDIDNMTGGFSGNFNLSGRGEDIDAIRRDLDGELAISLSDAALLGTDVWYNLRRARAMFKLQEPPPAPAEPKTDISSMTATGTVTNGILQNNDFVALLPFMRLEGQGSVNLPESTVDYDLTANILDRPELMTGASDEELAEFRSASIPLKITGPLTAPDVSTSIDDMFREQLKEKAEEKLLDALLGDEEPAEGQDAEDVLKEKLNDKLKDLFKK